MGYVFRWRPELVWVMVTAALTYLTTLLASDFEAVTDWRKFGIAAAAGLTRAVLAAILAAGTGGFRPEVPTGPAVPTVDERIGQTRPEPPNLPRDR